MRLLRLAVAFIEPAPSGGSFSCLPIGFASPRIEVNILASEQQRRPGPLRILLGADTTLVGILDSNGAAELIVPLELRQKMEHSIEHTVNLIAVRLGAKRRLASPSPCIALLPESDDDTQLLSTATGIAGEAPGFVSARGRNLLPGDVIGQLMDRLDGVALLAEGLSAGTALGEFHELVRVFERAFRCAGENLVPRLGSFLESAAGLGYTTTEVRYFLKDVRDPATHADTRDEYFLEAQIRPVIARVRQAAYDVLLNKTVWRDPSVERRKAWIPTAGLASPRSPFLNRGHEADLEFMPLDPYGTYPCDMTTKGNEVPAGWWSWAPSLELSSGLIEVR